MFTTGKRVGWVKQAALLCCLGGCSAIADFGADLGNARIADAIPVAWWHSLEGGAIAEQRPPPPGANDPYPNLSIVPVRPTPTPAAQRVALTAQLMAERDGVRREVARDPLTIATTPAPPAKKLADPASVPPPMATIDAATAPPLPAPSAPPLPAPSAPAAPKLLPDTVPAPPRKQSGRAPLPSGPMPELPSGPPSSPVLPGIPAVTFAPATRRPLPSVSIAFARDADQLPTTATATLQGLVDRRGGGPVLVYAGGDASSAAPGAQGLALALALRRAGAIGRALAAAGVPPAQTRTEATALGRDSGARLVQ